MEALGTFAGGIAHDFNNILTAVIGFSEMAKVSVSTDSKISKDLDKIIQAGRRGAALVDQILTFSRREEENFIPLDV